MNRRWLIPTLALLTAALPAQRPERPKLVVLVSVDQLAEWVFALGDPHFADDGGFRRLQRAGVTFAHCAFEHACTETGPGHATIGTGAPASLHGIVKNAWHVPEKQGSLYCVADDVEALDGLPEGKGRGPANLRAPTFADSLKAHVPGSKAVSVAWKDRSAILMGGGATDVAAWFEATTGNLVTNKAWCDEVPQWLQRFNEQRVVDSFFGAQWQRSGPDAAYVGLVDDRRYEYPHGNGSRARTLPQPLTGGKDEPEAAYYAQLYASPFGNTVVRRAAEAALRGEGLGQDDSTDLLCVSFSSTDLVGHYFGPDSVEARDALLRLDGELGALFATFDDAVGEGQWAAFVTADHGVAPTPEWARANGVAAGRGPIDAWVKSAVERRLREQFGELPDGGRYVAHVGEGGVFFARETIAKAGKAGALQAMARAAAEAAGGVRGMHSAFATCDLEAGEGSDDPVRSAVQKAVYPGRAGDVQLVLQPYWLNGGLPASHGTPHPYDREVVGFAIGPGLPAGATMAAPITPGFGAVLFAEMLSIPRPTCAHEHVPAGLLQRR